MASSSCRQFVFSLFEYEQREITTSRPRVSSDQSPLAEGMEQATHAPLFLSL